MITIRELMKSHSGQICSIDPDNTVYQALVLMANENIGAVLVIEGKKLIGVLTERDYARKVILKDRASKETKVREIMSTELFIMAPDQRIEAALELMSIKNVRHLPVVDGDVVLGVISILDVVRAIIEQQKETIQFYEEMDGER
jgi:CBS domain-containing protein